MSRESWLGRFGPGTRAGLAINRAAIRLTNYLLSFDGPFSPINAIYFCFVNRFIRR